MLPKKSQHPPLYNASLGWPQETSPLLVCPCEHVCLPPKLMGRNAPYHFLFHPLTSRPLPSATLPAKITDMNAPYQFLFLHPFHPSMASGPLPWAQRTHKHSTVHLLASTCFPKNDSILPLSCLARLAARNFPSPCVPVRAYMPACHLR